MLILLQLRVQPRTKLPGLILSFFLESRRFHSRAIALSGEFRQLKIHIGKFGPFDTERRNPSFTFEQRNPKAFLIPD
ncbi:hypothetical protein D3C73_1300810 [compost metagenome]